MCIKVNGVRCTVILKNVKRSDKERSDVIRLKLTAFVVR